MTDRDTPLDIDAIKARLAEWLDGTMNRADFTIYAAADLDALVGEVERLRGKPLPTPLYVVCSNKPGGPGNEAEFVELETADGRSVGSVGWEDYGDEGGHVFARLGPLYASHI